MSFGAFHRVENNFLKFAVEELLVLQLVLDFYQTVWSPYAHNVVCLTLQNFLARGNISHKVFSKLHTSRGE